MYIVYVPSVVPRPSGMRRPRALDSSQRRRVAVERSGDSALSPGSNNGLDGALYRACNQRESTLRRPSSFRLTRVMMISEVGYE